MAPLGLVHVVQVQAGDLLCGLQMDTCLFPILILYLHDFMKLRCLPQTSGELIMNSTGFRV